MINNDLLRHELEKYLIRDEFRYTVSKDPLGRILFDFDPDCFVLTDFLMGDLGLIFDHDIGEFDRVMQEENYRTYGNSRALTIDGEYVEIESNIPGDDISPDWVRMKKEEFIRIVHEYESIWSCKESDSNAK